MKMMTNDTADSPKRGNNSLGLLLLADAALKSNASPGNELFLNISEKLSADSDDSGRSSADGTDGSDNGSPNNKETNFCRPKLNYVPVEKFSKLSLGTADQLLLHQSQVDSQRNVSNLKQKMILPKPPNSTGSSVSSPEMKVREPRKRRKPKQPLPCSYCSKLFNNQSSLRQHESFHRPNRPFKCEHAKCEKAYKTRSELNRHLVVHSGEKKHLCKICGKKFLRKQYLKTHLLRHHDTGVTMVIPADEQNISYCPSSVVQTLSIVKSNFVAKAEPLTWRCQLCMKIFVDSEDLTKHLRSYHGKKKLTGVIRDDEQALAVAL